MAHDEHRTLVVHEEVLQPDDALQVEVVGGLVEQQHIWVAEEGLRQQHLDLEPRVDLPHEALVQLLRHAQSLQDAPRVGFRLPAAELGELLLQLRRAQTVLVGEVGLVVDGLALPAAVVEALVAEDHGVEHAVVVIEALILLENRHAPLRRELYRAGSRLQLAGEDLDEGGFAGAIGADDTVAVAAGELQIHLGKQHG